MTILFALILAVAGSPLPAPQSATPPKSPSALIDAVDRTFASMKDFSADFVQFSTNSVNQKQRDEGHLYLTKDKKMRWEYTRPEEKLFVSNGKTLYTYTPQNHQAIKEQVKDSAAEQIPLMFLIGRSGLKNEFKEITELLVKPSFEGDRVLRLTPKKKNEDIETIDIEVNPVTYLISRMVIIQADKSSTEFIFMNMDINKNIPASKFEFTPPLGTRVVQGEANQ